MSSPESIATAAAALAMWARKRSPIWPRRFRKSTRLPTTARLKAAPTKSPWTRLQLRGPRDTLKTRDRAVTLEDFALLASETPGALVARANAYVTEPNSPDGEACGRIITVVIVPSSEVAKPVPSEVALDLVCRYLDERRLITTQVRVQGPPYHHVDVVIDVRARDSADLKAVKSAIADRLSAYFHPLKGGEDGKGWPFGAMSTTRSLSGKS